MYKRQAPISEIAGTVSIEDTEKSLKVVITPESKDDEPMSYPVLRRARLLVSDGDRVEVGQQLVSGAVDPKEVLRIRGPREAQKHLVDEVQGVYRSQGVGIHDKHVEVIVRQMTRRITVIESGDTDLLPGELVETVQFQQANKKAVQEQARPAAGRPELMGITKASLATDSWLSAASFQETTRVLTQAAMEGKSDPLVGLKENVIIGKLIPAGTGLDRYNDIEVEPTEEAREQMYANSTGFADFSYAGETDGSVAAEFHAIPLEEYPGYGS